MEFLGDQGRDVIVVYRFLKHGDLMFIGPQTSIGNMYLGPWYYYLMAPALLLAGFNPVGPAVMVALFGVATVWLVWKVGKEWFGEKVGLIAALLIAVSPVVIYYSIFSWNPNIMPFFALLSMWLLWRIWQKNEYQKMPILAVSLVMVLNSHYLGLLLLPVVGIFWLLGLKRAWGAPNRSPYILHTIYFILIFLVLMFPLFLFDLKHDFSNFNAFRQFFTNRQTTVNLKFYKGFLKVPEIVNQLFANLLTRQDRLRGVYLLIPFIFWGIWMERKSRAMWLMLLWFVVGILGLTNYKQHVYAHYFGFLWPAAVLLLAIFLRKLKIFGWLIIFYMVYMMVGSWHGWKQPNYQLRRASRLADFIIKESNQQKFALALLAEQNYDAPYRYFLMLRKAPLVDLHREITDQLFVICEPWGKVNCNPIGHPKWQIAAFGWAKIAGEWELEGVKVFELVHQE
jgi:4-amino-4-deoxy-L-arabinose transferase-like glycosyltransferase